MFVQPLKEPGDFFMPAFGLISVGGIQSIIRKINIEVAKDVMHLSELSLVDLS